MPAPYVHERQVEYWTSRGIEDFFMDSGFEVFVMPLTQLAEAAVPSDFIFRETSMKKLFGFQFKALYRNGSDFWNLDQQQHQTLERFDWMYYGLSDLTSASQQRTALHYLRVLAPTFAYQPRLQVGSMPYYIRWAKFYEGLQACQLGRRVHTPDELRTALWPYQDAVAPREIAETADEVLLADFANRRVARFSTLLAR
jgi:hypothetical protein